MYVVNGKKYREDPTQKLGGGSEGQVFTFPDDPSLCVKIFHEAEKGDKEGEQLAAYRAKKVAAICKFVPQLKMPDQFILPQQPTFDGSGRVSGFLMRKISAGHQKAKRLLEVQFRNDHEFHLRKLSELFVHVFDDAAIVHGHNLTIRDINTGFMLFNPQLTSGRVYVDTDSYSYPGFPSIATTELFCHPDLYPDLVSGSSGLVVTKPHHDRFSLLVMYLLMALQGAHPFRMGVHGKFRSLRERCQNGITILDSDVTYPPFLPPREILSDDLLHEIVKRLKRQTDEPLPSGFLKTFGGEVIGCPSCKTQYHRSRRNCPKCQERTLLQVAAQAIEELYRSAGVVLFAQTVSGSLRIACRVAGKLQLVLIDANKRVTLVTTQLQAKQGMRYRFFDSYLVICENPLAESPVNLVIYKIEGQQIRQVHQTTTNALENASAIFETSGKFLYRTASNSLMCGRFFNGNFMEQVVCSVHRNQTWFTADKSSGAAREVLFGYDRALKDYQWFIITGTEDGEKFVYKNLNLPLRTREKLEDFALYFNSTSVLLVRKTIYAGNECVHYTLVNLDGVVTQDVVLTERDPGFEFWTQIEGKLFQSNSVLHLSSQGIVKQDLKDNSYTTVGNTSMIVSDDRLLRFGKTLAVVRRDSLLVVTPSKK